MSLSRKLMMLGLSVLMAALIGSSVRAQQESPAAPWTTVGSAGTVDQADLLNVALGSPVSGAVSMWFGGTVRIRYNVVAVAGVLGGSGVTLTARYRHGTTVSRGGTRGQVIVRLMKYSLATGVQTNLLTLDSNSFPAANGFQVQSVATSACFPPFTTLDFVNNSYFMDVSLTRTPGPFDDISVFSTRPALAMIRLASDAICIL